MKSWRGIPNTYYTLPSLFFDLNYPALANLANCQEHSHERETDSVSLKNQTRCLRPASNMRCLGPTCLGDCTSRYVRNEDEQSDNLPKSHYMTREIPQNIAKADLLD